MLRKIYNYISSIAIIILILVIVLISQINNKKDIDYSDWIRQDEKYITAVAEIGDVYKNIRKKTEVSLNSSKSKSYIVNNFKIRDDLHEGSVIQPGECLDKDMLFEINYLGKIESIICIDDDFKVVVNDFTHFFVQLMLKKSIQDIL